MIETKQKKAYSQPTPRRGCRDKKSLRVIETMRHNSPVTRLERFRCRDKKSLRVIETMPPVKIVGALDAVAVIRRAFG